MLATPRATGARSIPKKYNDEYRTAAVVEEQISVVRECMATLG
jgi:hypothetical protein